MFHCRKSLLAGCTLRPLMSFLTFPKTAQTNAKLYLLSERRFSSFVKFSQVKIVVYVFYGLDVYSDWRWRACLLNMTLVSFQGSR